MCQLRFKSFQFNRNKVNRRFQSVATVRWNDRTLHINVIGDVTPQLIEVEVQEKNKKKLKVFFSSSF